jgi:glycosyltransferase involved in cell wall biosynthesis
VSPLRYLASLGRALVRPESGRLHDFLRAAWLAAELRRARVAHLHAHFASDPAAVAELAARIAGVPYSISAHAKDIWLSSEASLRRKLDGASFTVTCTEHNRAHLQAVAPRARVLRMYHGIDIEHLQAPASRAPLAGRPARILSVGRLREKKGFGTLVETCALLRDRGIDVHVEIVGYGPERARLEALIAERALGDAIQLTGRLDHAEVVRRYAQADLFVLPCRVLADGDRDGIPNVLLEAMAMGLPVVSTAISGIPELVADGRNGLLVPPDDPAAVATAIERLLADADLRARLGVAARATVAEHFTDRNLETLCHLLPGNCNSVPGVAVPQPMVELQHPAPNCSFAGAYVLKGFPRLSETFIANEIHELEGMGLRLRLYSVKGGETHVVHDVVRRIRAQVEYLPELTSLSGTPLLAWLRVNLPRVAQAHARLVRRRPLAYLATLMQTLRMCWRYRERGVPHKVNIRKVYIKEFLQAGEICHGATTITWCASRLAGLPFSFTAHAKDIYLGELNPRDLLARKLAAARFVATCTGANARHLRERATNGGRVHTIYHGLDTRFFAPTDARREGHDARPLVVSVGRFVEKKGFQYLVEACARLHADGVSLRCLILGENGPDQERIARMIGEAGLEGCVELRGPVAQQALRALYREASLFVLPCQVVADGDRDGIPNVLAEAMASGVAIISTDISGIPELVTHGVDGLLVPARDAAALAAAMRSLIDDPDLRGRLGDAARATICARFDAKKTTRALRDLFARSMAASAVRA